VERQVHDAEQLQPLFSSYPADRIEAYAVSTLGNSPVHDNPDCIEPYCTAETEKKGGA
jgi:putative SOS response-associated peptidase YedK